MTAANARVMAFGTTRSSGVIKVVVEIAGSRWLMNGSYRHFRKLSWRWHGKSRGVSRSDLRSSARPAYFSGLTSSE